MWTNHYDWPIETGSTSQNQIRSNLLHSLRAGTRLCCAFDESEELWWVKSAYLHFSLFHFTVRGHILSTARDELYHGFFLYLLHMNATLRRRAALTTPNKRDPSWVITNQTNLTLKSYCTQQHFLHSLPQSTWLGDFNQRFKSICISVFFGFGTNFVNLFWPKNLGTFWILLFF